MEQLTQFAKSPKKFTVIAFFAGMMVVALIWLFVRQQSPIPYGSSSFLSDSGSYGASKAEMPSPAAGDVAMTSSDSSIVGNSQTRRVTSNYLSVHVKNVGSFHNSVVSYVGTISGKVMSEYTTVSSDDKSESGTLTVLVPNSKAQEFFDFLNSQAIKVVDRQVNSYVITQEYTDITRQLAQYEATYAKVLNFYDRAKTVSELLEIQRQLTFVQQNIDSLKGRKMALDELSSNTQYTIYSSTNEFNLPYVPEGTFEVAKTFKLAVRSLVATSDKLVKGAIYVIVFLPLVLVALAIALVIKKYMTKN